MNTLSTALVSLSLMLSFSSYGASVPRPSYADSRVTTIPYNPNDVVEVFATAGYATHFILENGESYQTHAFGDSAAWHFSAFKNHVFIKPRQVRGDTNLVIITDRRTYNFNLKYTSGVGQVYTVRFTYPDTQKLVNERENAASILNNEFSFDNPAKQYNLSYLMRGNTSIAPTNVWDDGTFTYFKFSGNKDLPAIYEIGMDGKEAIINKTALGSGNSVIALHKVSRSWILRLGRTTLEVKNARFDDVGVLNTSGTSSENVIRVVNGNGE